ncbi:NAD(P)-binding domain-containing protein [Nocardiopsis flavescens]|uniref:Predicted flavoprotein CzcO associated with the cation diffusion facilitator CzcD n=1 Tax=Nocardiopsis flavescens TaxID=758803 RepID=A0A1M6HLM9_9ACTN|nr:NAD(P)-binding domain-containing protein [Nocardiopsis flavescens]SHJ23118.1 Predicted flavoprotein CzcO associated with the cation diffusion facilitator CzcD [Nocardiopsis flavescens]
MADGGTGTGPGEAGGAEAVVVGAGQAGLSVAWHLRRMGLVPGEDAVVLDRGPAPGGAWQFRWEALRLDDAHKVEDLPGMREIGLSFATADGARPARDIVREYYDRYERAFDLRVRRPVRVTAVREAGDGRLRVETDRGALLTRVLVNASGTWGRPFRPYFAGAAGFRGVQVSTPQYRAARDFAGLRVAVVGGGTSATGFLHELEGVAAATVWVTRRPVRFTDDPGAGVAAVRQADEAARAGRPLPSISGGTGLPATPRNLAAVERGLLVARPMFAAIEPDGLRWADGSFEPVDAIIWATGFRSELTHLAPLGLREPEGGLRVEQGRAVRDPRVFLAGYGPQASTIGANRAGRTVARQVVEHLRAPAGV